MDCKLFQKSLIEWYQKNKRELPWRQNKNEYQVWLSEVMLQQTQVATVIPYYQKFVRKIPNIRSLAMADEEFVLKLWEGLGYYQRIKNFHQAAQIVVKDEKGKFPGDHQKFLTLPGVGPYIAAAVFSICFNQPFAVVDGNVKRVLSRLYLFSDPVNKLSGFQKLADATLEYDNPGIFNQAMMELGATICLPKNPKCDQCPVTALCLARKKDLISNYPVKASRKKTPIIYKNAFVPLTGQKYIWLQKRSGSRFLSGLWEIPMVAIPEKASVHHKNNQKWIKHVYSHFTEMVRIQFVKKLPESLAAGSKVQLVKISDLEAYALTGVSRKIIRSIIKNAQKSVYRKNDEK